jgi:multicomponent Na+:H+ antiporter subunit C
MTHVYAASVLLGASDSVQSIQGQGVYNYWLVIVLMMTGLYLVLSRANMVKTVIGLNLFQAAVIMFYVSMGRVDNGTAPIFVGNDINTEQADLSRTNTVVKETKSEVPYSNPLPHVLMLTAIVVGVATTSLALSLVVRVNEAYGTIEEDDLLEKEAAA